MRLGNGRSRHWRKLRKSGFAVILLDVILLIVALLVFALFHHALPRKLTPAGETSAYAAATTAFAEEPPVAMPIQQPAEATPIELVLESAPQEQPVAERAAAPADAPVAASAEAAAAPGDFSRAFPGADTGAGALYSYQTDTVRIAVNRVQENQVTYYIADVWIKNISDFHTAFAKDTYGRGIHEFPAKTAKRNGAVLSVSGDYYSARASGVVIREGKLYRDVSAEDVCALYNDGEMRTYRTDAFDVNAAMARGVWQTWSFGPALLDENGGALTYFPTGQVDRHPRNSIGYYAPGHYCIVMVDGRQKGYSIGMRLDELSALYARLGCKQAYNLDGGATAVMTWNDQIVNQPYKGGRESSDFIWFA